MSSTEDASQPAQWHVERNSYLEETALRLKSGHIELLSAGNKYLPIIRVRLPKRGSAILAF